MTKRYNRFKPSELSDRMMNLNRIEDKNLANKLRQIEKETRVSLNSINRDIKHLEDEHQTQQKLVNSLNHSAKVKFLNAHLHMAILQNRKLENDMKRFAMDQDEIKQGLIVNSKISWLIIYFNIFYILEDNFALKETTTESITLPKINIPGFNTNDTPKQRAQSARPSISSLSSKVLNEQTEIISLKYKEADTERSKIRGSKMSKDPLKFFEKQLKEKRKSLTIDELPHLILDIGLSKSKDNQASCFNTSHSRLMNITVV